MLAVSLSVRLSLCWIRKNNHIKHKLHKFSLAVSSCSLVLDITGLGVPVLSGSLVGRFEEAKPVLHVARAHLISSFGGVKVQDNVLVISCGRRWRARSLEVFQWANLIASQLEAEEQKQQQAEAEDMRQISSLNH